MLFTHKNTDTFEFEHNVLLPQFNAYLKTINAPFMILSRDDSLSLSLVDYGYNAIEGFFASFAKYQIYKGEVYKTEYEPGLSGTEAFCIVRLGPDETVSELRSLVSDVRRIERASRKKDLWSWLWGVAALVFFFLWQFAKIQ